MLESRRSGESGALLEGFDVPVGTKTVTNEVAEVRESPEEFGARDHCFSRKPDTARPRGPSTNQLEALIKHFGDDPTKLLGGNQVGAISFASANRRYRPSLAVSPRQ